VLVTLTEADRPRLEPLLAAAPLDTLFVATRIDRFGLDANKLGCPVIGVIRGGQLVAAVHAGANLAPIGDPSAFGEVIENLGQRVRTQSILGPAHLVLPLYNGLVQRWGTSWAQARELRAHQPLMCHRAGTPLPVTPDPRVREVMPSDLDVYYMAATRMYTEEVGNSPFDVSDSYRQYVRFLVTNGRAFGAFDSDRVWYKTDVGGAYGGVCQVQGVWLDPALRGHGMAESLMAAVLRLVSQRWPVVSLYVNDYNVRARRVYDRLGLEVVGEYATVLY